MANTFNAVFVQNVQTGFKVLDSLPATHNRNLESALSTIYYNTFNMSVLIILKLDHRDDKLL